MHRGMQEGDAKGEGGGGGGGGEGGGGGGGGGGARWRRRAPPDCPPSVAEPPEDRATVGLTGTEHHRSEVRRPERRLVRAVRKGLRLERESVALPVRRAAGPRSRAVEEVAGVDLHAGRVARDGEGQVPATDGGGLPQTRPADHEVVVGAPVPSQLRVVTAHRVPDPGGTAQVQRGAVDSGQLAGGDQPFKIG